jgi:predicted AAA+ superfamily ATPase
VDQEIDLLLRDLPALSLAGPKGVGKTRSAERRAKSFFRFDDPMVAEIFRAQPSLVTLADSPTLIDEWQRIPSSWDVVRRSIDDNPSPGRFILTGSATPSVPPAHSGASRIFPLRMRPLTLDERGFGPASVSLGELLLGKRPEVEGQSWMVLDDYVDEILTGGFPGMRHSTPRSQRTALNGYLERVVDTDVKELGVAVRNPGVLLRWLRAYAAATATSTSFEKIREAASAGGQTGPARSTAIPFRDALSRIWILDDLPAWTPTRNHLRQVSGVPKHHLCDPALAARLLELDRDALLSGHGPSFTPRDGAFLGALFESLAVLNIRVFAQLHGASSFHFRDHRGRHEVDMVVARDDQRVVAVEVKMSEEVRDEDVSHLRWLKEELGPDLLDAVVVTTGQYAYRRPDGVAVVPLGLLSP